MLRGAGSHSKGIGTNKNTAILSNVVSLSSEDSPKSVAYSSILPTATLESNKPSKIVTKNIRMQFTCLFREFNLGGRIDTKGIKTILTSLRAKRVVVLRGKGYECDSIAACAVSLGSVGYAPNNNETISFEERVERIRVELPQKYLSNGMGVVMLDDKKLSGSGGSGSGSGYKGSCFISSIRGKVGETVSSGVSGYRVVRLMDKEEVIEDAVQSIAVSDNLADNSEVEVEVEEVEGGVEDMTEMNYDSALNKNDDGILNVSDDFVVNSELKVGAISNGEVQLNRLKQMLEKNGVSVEYRLSSTGGTLVCGNQVLLKKEQENDFVIEGPPTALYYRVRQILYSRFAFI